MKKILLLLLFIPLVSFGQLTYEEKNILAAEIFETFSEDYIKKSLFILVKLDEKAVIAAANKCLNDNDWEAQRDCEREIERTDRLAWYKKQKWWKKLILMNCWHLEILPMGKKFSKNAVLAT